MKYSPSMLFLQCLQEKNSHFNVVHAKFTIKAVNIDSYCKQCIVEYCTHTFLKAKDYTIKM
uniref:Uncharacterized protein n=1 Tax=Arion vulgaris TaxID=1028688 RepID=A0A0B6ZBN5_9EUPU